jgi:hypothetical protein
MSFDLPEHSDSHRIAQHRSQSAGRKLGVGLAGLVFVLVVGHIVWNITVAYHLVPPELRGNGLLQTNLSTVTITLVGGLIIWNQPGNRIGWLLLLAGLYAVLLPDLSFDYAGLGLVVAPKPPEPGQVVLDPGDVNAGSLGQAIRLVKC